MNPLLVFAVVLSAPAPAPVESVDLQPLAAQAARVAEALDSLGAPLAAADRKTVRDAAHEADPAKGVAAIQRALDPYCLFVVSINPESRVKVAAGPARPELVEQGWRTFLVKVVNEAGVTAALNVVSPNAGPLANAPKDAIANRWLDLLVHTTPPLTPQLSGLTVEYRVLSLFSRDAGRREATIAFNVGQGTQDIGFRNAAAVLFTIQPAVDVTLRVRDADGRPCMAAFEIRDRAGRICPSRAKRLAPDFAFQDQIYRRDGETIKLAPGSDRVAVSRGPEYLRQRRLMTIPPGKKHEETFHLVRWIDPAAWGWYSGDHHIHAAGCAHYSNPTEGVFPRDMIRHILGEDLKVGCVLTWGPCYAFQKNFFEGKVNRLSTADHLMRYDVEVSGFPSSHAGHLDLLRLTDQEFPRATWDLPILRWAKRQGAVVGFAHSGWGLNVPTDQLPNFVPPPMDGIGANEYIVDVTHGVCDFISAVDTPFVWELNIWYHTLNCGYRTRIGGETDFPCIYGQRVGRGRSYVQVDGPLDYDAWVHGVRDGRSYVSDGKSHLMDFAVNGLGVGVHGSELKLAGPAAVKLTARVAARLEEKPVDAIRKLRFDQQPYWDIERARVGDTRQVPVEVVVNGSPVARRLITADGSVQSLSFTVPIRRSSWVALRILPSSHTNPVFVLVGDKPIRASRRSAEWCLHAVDRCWTQKVGATAAAERPAARRAYDHARAAYRRIIAQSEAE